MFKKLCITSLFCFLTAAFCLSAMDYEILDIGTLQTSESQAIAINNEGQILGWYNIDGSSAGKHFFVRDQDGGFCELPAKEPSLGLDINWKYLTDEGKIYGTVNVTTDSIALWSWDKKNGAVNLGLLPGTQISAINNAGQVLIESVIENENGKSVRRPVIWKDGIVTNLKGLSGDLGIEAGEAYGFGMNNHGDVVGQSAILLSYKNTLYKQVHATMWVDGKPVDIHDKMKPEFGPRSETIATAINDNRDVLMEGFILYQNGGWKNIGYGVFCSKMTQKFICCPAGYSLVFDLSGKNVLHSGIGANDSQKNPNSIWMRCEEIRSVNNKGEAIAQGKTIYGENHIMLLKPKGSE